MKPRYILNYHSGINIFNDSGEKIQTVFSSLTTLHEPLVYIDLLEKTTDGNCNLVKIRAFLPKGQVVEGFVVGYMIDISYKDGLYNGMFNSVPRSLD